MILGSVLWAFNKSFELGSTAPWANHHITTEETFYGYKRYHAHRHPVKQFPIFMLSEVTFESCILATRVYQFVHSSSAQVLKNFLETWINDGIRGSRKSIPVRRVLKGDARLLKFTQWSVMFLFASSTLTCSKVDMHRKGAVKDLDPGLTFRFFNQSCE